PSTWAMTRTSPAAASSTATVVPTLSNGLPQRCGVSCTSTVLSSEIMWVADGSLASAVATRSNSPVGRRSRMAEALPQASHTALNVPGDSSDSTSSLLLVVTSLTAPQCAHVHSMLPSLRDPAPRRSRAFGPRAQPSCAAPGLCECDLVDDDPVHDGVVDAGDELDHHLTARVGGRRERMSDGDVLPARVREDVEVGQDLLAVDDHVEHALSGGRPEVLHEVQRDAPAPAWREAAHPVGHRRSE